MAHPVSRTRHMRVERMGGKLVLRHFSPTPPKCVAGPHPAWEITRHTAQALRDLAEDVELAQGIRQRSLPWL